MEQPIPSPKRYWRRFTSSLDGGGPLHPRASGKIVVRGRSYADARRIAAAINATRDIPTDALERWLVQDVSDPHTRPDLEVDLDSTDPGRSPYLVTPYDRRHADRRQAERRAPSTGTMPEALLFDRRVMERRISSRRLG